MTPYPSPSHPRRRHPFAAVLSIFGFILFGTHSIGAGIANPPGYVPSPHPRAAAAVAQAGFQISSGNGNHAIDPNECNALNLALTNSSNRTISGINASFATSDPDVIITQPISTFPDLPPGGVRTNDVPFQISTLPGFAAGRTIYGSLTLASPSAGLLSVPVALTTGEISPLNSRWDNNAGVGIPDVGIVESTNAVTNFSGTLAKVVVSLYLTHPSDQALTNLSLIAPDGTTVLLSAGNGGAGKNYGSGTADASRTVFDDFATNRITAASAPFVGTFKPQTPLSTFYGKTNVNGAWRLHIADGSTGSVGTLQAWSLFLYPVTSSDGGGACALCSSETFLTNYLSASSGILPQRLYRDSNPSACGPAKPFPGLITNYSGGFSYQAYPFYNGSSPTCITVTLTATTADVMSAAFVSTFNPANPQATWLADSGKSTRGASAISYSFSVNANTVFIILVNDVDEINVSNTTTNGSYGLAVGGGDCTPYLNITHTGTNLVNVSWAALAGDFRLQTSTRINPVLWNLLTNEPVANAGRFNVTNRSDLTPLQIYRLQGY